MSDRHPPAPATDPLQQGYRALRRVLATNSELLEQLADLEADLRHFDPCQHQIREPVLQLLDGSLLLAENLNILTGNRHARLYDSHTEIDQAVRSYLRQCPGVDAAPLALSLDDARALDAADAGGKAAHLARLRQAMPEVVPPGFVVTTSAFRRFLIDNAIMEPIRQLLRNLSFATERDLFRQRTAAVRSLIAGSRLPEAIDRAIAAGLALVPTPADAAWAVRSSAVGEDGQVSFAGQFDSVLNVPATGIAAAYRDVIASRYSDRAMIYRILCGLTEVRTPMAVLCLPMVDARTAGVLYTRDPAEVTADRMVINAVPGLADDLVRGKAHGETYLPLRRGSRDDAAVASTPMDSGRTLAAGDLRALVEIGLRVEQLFDTPQDIEWAIDRGGRVQIVQSRPLRTGDPRETRGKQPNAPVLLQGGVTVFPGRAVGPPHFALTTEELIDVAEGALLVVDQATPELTAVLPILAGIVCRQGNPAGHAATLIREFGIPTVFGMEGAAERLRDRRELSLDATNRKLYDGALWPEVRARVRHRIHRARSGTPDGLLHQRILALNLTDPQSPSFTAARCQSVHDIIRYTHEKAVGAMFDLGDAAVRKDQRRVCKLKTDIAIGLTILDLGGVLPAAAREQREVLPEQVASTPFAALWRGIATAGISWSGRRALSATGFASVLASSMLDPGASTRELGASNYLIVGPDYLNLNARLAYHFAMVDALVSDAAENNYVNFRFRGGGADTNRLELRARFLAEVFLRSGFGVDRRGDLVTAWLRRFGRPACEDGLVLIGRLMGCARQLDMLMDSEAAVHHFVDRFLQGDYGAFA